MEAHRWRLGRAGILNVYQYGDEVLEFAGGRLLLRGVNGSGKSTAMNMLLPFLLDGDTRRIDAAGEQSGVLKSWMLAGRDDAQPIGYLWLELQKGTEHLAFGCGIKANRAADTVATWWWVTSRRPGIDFLLVEDQRPLSMEALRRVLGGDPVFRQEQRAAYRAEIRTRLFGGAELDQHIRLLHIVRSPRVGDRLDLDLPAHLHDALPQLSEAALADAAQPLDELEEHRRNVGELTRTAATLEALTVVYGDYARAELRRRALAAAELADTAEQARRVAAAGERLAGTRAQEAAAAGARVEQLAGQEGRLRVELESLKQAPAYTAGQDLEDLRRLVQTLERAVWGAEGDVAAREQEREAAGEAVASGAATARADHGVLGGLLRELSAEVVAVGLSLGAPDLPPLETARLGRGILGDGDGVDLDQPVGSPPVETVRVHLEQLGAAVVHRRGDVEEVRRGLEAVGRAEERCRRAGAERDTARRDAAAKNEALAERQGDLEREEAGWLDAVGAWLLEHAAHRASSGLAPVAPPDVGGRPRTRRGEIVAQLEAQATSSADRHGETLAALRARATDEEAALDDARRRVGELEAVALPPPPSLAWQRADRGVVLAEAVDFRDGIDEAARAGLEAALEAAGLLAAEVTAEGGLAGADGTLLVRPGPRAAESLGTLLRVGDDLGVRVDAAAVDRLLQGISVVLGDAEHEAAVTVDGRFRVGPLSGRHTKEAAEHIGGTARRAALERQRGEARARLAEAEQTLRATGMAVVAHEAWLSAARELRDRVPRGEALTRALVEVDAAARDADRADGLVVEREMAVVAADVAHAEAVDACRRDAARLALPTTAHGLRDVERALSVLERAAHDARAHLVVWSRALTAWADAARRWETAATAAEVARAALGEARARHEPEAARLATLEDAVGAEYEQLRRDLEVCEAGLEVARRDLEAAREERIEAHRLAAAAEAEGRALEVTAIAAADRCVAVLPTLRAALAVPGLVAAAVGDEATFTEPVERSPSGVRRLAGLVVEEVPAPGRADVGADGVRNSLRQRRDSLGAGWDAEDRQPDDALPLAVEVTGPEGRMPLVVAAALVADRLGELGALLTAEQDHALRNLLQGMVAREVAEKLRAGGDLIDRMNARLDTVTTAHGIGVSLRWRRRDGLPPEVDAMVDLLAKPPDLRTPDQEVGLRAALSSRLEDARREEPDAPYRDLVARVLDYRSWHEISLLLRRPGRPPERLSRRSALSEGEKKIVSYLPLFAAVAASCDSLAERAPDAPRFLLLDDAFAKVSEDNHPKLFGLLVELDLDFVATSERLWGTHATVPELAITEVIRDADLGVIVLEHSSWTATSGLAPR